jgi:hypothetical protein
VKSSVDSRLSTVDWTTMPGRRRWVGEFIHAPRPGHRGHFPRARFRRGDRS